MIQKLTSVDLILIGISIFLLVLPFVITGHKKPHR